MSSSAFIVRVPEAEASVGALRKRFDASARLGVPSHITVLYPFMPPDRIDDKVIRQVRSVLAAVPSFAFKLEDVARFAATAYLVPVPAQPFVAMTRGLAGRFPDYPPFRGEHDDIVPHLTVAHGDARDAELAERQLGAVMRAHGPIHARCRAVALIENSSGRWKEMHAFELSDER